MRSFMTIFDEASYDDNWWDVLWYLMSRLMIIEEAFYDNKWWGVLW